MAIVFQNCCRKHPSKVCLVQNLGFFIFPRNIVISQIGGVLRNGSLKHPNNSFLVLNLRIFVFVRNSAVRQIVGNLFPIW